MSEPKKLLIAEKTMLGIINFDGKVGAPFIIINSNIQVVTINETDCVIRVGADLSQLKKCFKIPKKLWKNVVACFDFTNDPTNDIAGLCVSLGYWVQRHKILKAELLSLNPLTFKCKKENYTCHFTRPMRPLYDSEESLMFNKLKKPLKRYVNETKNDQS